MKNIGSKQAATLAKAQYGPKAYVARSGKKFYVGKFSFKFGHHYIDLVLGEGKSWEQALVASGITVPQPLQIGFPPIQVSDNLARFNVNGDADPNDSDAKEPLGGGE